MDQPLGKHRVPRQRLSQPDSFDIPGALDLLREVIGRTDALVYASERHFERYSWFCTGADESDDSERPLEHPAHLIGAARESAISAVSLGTTIAAELVRRGGAT